MHNVQAAATMSGVTRVGGKIVWLFRGCRWTLVPASAAKRLHRGKRREVPILFLSVIRCEISTAYYDDDDNNNSNNRRRYIVLPASVRIYII